MASMNFQKATSGKIGGMKRHLDMEERMTREHSNEDINKSLTEQNYFIGCDSWNDMYFSWKDRTKEVDKLHPPTRIKSDRVTGVLCECPCPWEIVNQGKEREFFEMIAEHLKEKFGAENFHGLTVHRDEVHAYTDPDGTEKMSMIHCHALVTPYAHWKDKKGIEHEGINGKNWETKSMLHDFNDSLNEKCLERFGYELNTHGLAMHKSVEQLKKEGRALQNQRNIDKAIVMVREKNQELKNVQAEIAETQEHLTMKRAEEDALNNKIEDMEKNLKDKSMQLRKANAIEKASQEMEMPEMKPQTFGNGIIVQTDKETLIMAFTALSHEKNIAKREEASRSQARKIVSEAKTEAEKEVQKLQAKISSLKKERDDMSYTSAKRQLAEIKEDHPRIFNSMGVYQRGHSIEEMEKQQPHIKHHSRGM